MSSEHSVAKICVACGEDCAHKPRTKDTRGRYYCQECYDRIRSGFGKPAPVAGEKSPSAKPRPSPKPSAKSKPAPSPPDSLPPSLRPPPAPSDVLAIEFDQVEPNFLEDLIATAPPVSEQAIATPVNACHGCGKAVHPSAVICTACGFDLVRQSKGHKTAIKKAQRVATGGVIWPPVVGWISFVIGALGFLGYGFLLVSATLSAFNAKAGLREALVVLGVLSLFTWLAAWLARDGYRIAHRNSDGVKWIRFWAMAKLLLFGTCLSIIMAAPIKPIDDALVQVRAQGGPRLTASEIKQWFLLGLLFFMAWPMFILVFLFIPRIQDDVEAWD